MRYIRKFLDGVGLTELVSNGSAYGWLLPAYSTYTLPHLTTVKVETGIAVDVPDGWCAWVIGHPALQDLDVHLAGNVLIEPGNYRSICISLVNFTARPIEIEHGAPVARLLLTPVYGRPAVEDEDLDQERSSLLSAFTKEFGYPKT